MKSVKWGIIGCGNVTEVKSGPAFNIVENSALVAVMRRDAGKAKDYAKRHGVPHWYTDANELIADKEVNAIYVATPPDTHASYTIKALESGKPVYVEKPMTRNFSECQQMIEVAEEMGMSLFVAYYRRALPGFLKVKELINTGEIGEVRYVKIEYIKPASEDEKAGNLPWRVKPEISGAGHFFDLGSHQIDYLNFILGPIIDVQSMILNQGKLYEAEDMVVVNFKLENNIVATGTWCFAASDNQYRDLIEIIGSQGSISLSCFDFTPIELNNKNGLKKFEYPKPEHVQEFLIRDVVNDLLGKGKSSSTGYTGAQTTQILDRIVWDYYNRK